MNRLARLAISCALAVGCLDPDPTVQQSDLLPVAAPVDAGSPLPPPPAPELMENGGYEAGLLGWEVVGSGTLERSTNVFHQGGHSARLSERLSPGDGLGQGLQDRLTPTSRYQVRVFVAVGGLALEETDESGWHLARLVLTHQCGLPSFDLVDERAVISDGWTELSGEFWAPPCRDGSAMLYVDGPVAGVDLYLDTWSLSGVASASGP